MRAAQTARRQQKFQLSSHGCLLRGSGTYVSRAWRSFLVRASWSVSFSDKLCFDSRAESGMVVKDGIGRKDLQTVHSQQREIQGWLD